MSSVWSSIQEVSRLGLTSTKSQNVDGEEIRDFGTAVGQKGRSTRADHQDVRNTANGNTNTDEVESASLCVCQVAKDDWESIHQHGEGLSDGVGLDCAQAQGTCGLLGASCGCSVAIAADWKRTVDKVADQGLNSIVRGAFAEFDGANDVCDDGQRSWYTAKVV